MTVIDDLLADPLGFLSTNALQFEGNVNVGAGKSGMFYVEPYPSMHVRYRTGSKFLGMGNSKADGRAYKVRFKKPEEPLSKHAVQFEAVWSGYKGGIATYCELPSTGGADIMLTPRMDGCTLTFAASNTGGMKFGHCNIKGADKNTVTAQEMQDAVADEINIDNATVLTKEYYYSQAKRNSVNTGDKRTIANAVGVRDNGVWKFYIQYLEPKGVGAAGCYQIRHAEHLAQGAKYISAV